MAIRIYVESDKEHEGKSTIISHLYKYLKDRGAVVNLGSFPEIPKQRDYEKLIDSINSTGIDWRGTTFHVQELGVGWNPTLTTDDREDYERLKKRVSILETQYELPE